MEILAIEETSSTPSINFNPKTNVLEMKGESYPEDTSSFYHPVFEWLDDYLDEVKDSIEVKVNFELIYFNSSSSKVLMDFFDKLEEAVEDGKNIKVFWYYEEENEMALEYGEEFEEDLESLPFELVVKEEAEE